jgi:hypothetical protein
MEELAAALAELGVNIVVLLPIDLSHQPMAEPQTVIPTVAGVRRQLVFPHRDLMAEHKQMAVVAVVVVVIMVAIQVQVLAVLAAHLAAVAVVAGWLDLELWETLQEQAVTAVRVV